MQKIQELLDIAKLAHITYTNYWYEQASKYKNNQSKLNQLIFNIESAILKAKNKADLVNQAKITYPPELPVSQEIDNIRNIVLANQVVIICGETGSGKTTQLPKLLLEMGLGSSGVIGHTQPRRIATRSLAARISVEINLPDLVGYKMRFHDKTNETTAIKLMTDGILLQEIANDNLLLQYSAIILDEAHERSLNIDFLLGYLQQLLFKRPDFKLIITSATIDNEKLSKFFYNAPIINVSGKTYPVDIVYQPLDAEDGDIAFLNQRIYQAISGCLGVEQGNVLVFLPGEREIKDCIYYLQKTELSRYQLLALYSRQNNDAQNLIFEQNGNLKIIVTTNIAETSLTIPGVKYVIDSGIARIKRYNIRNRVEQLLIEPIAKSSAKQRAGRAGRLSHGMCVRLYSEQDYNLRAEYSEPELLRSNLANVILRLLNLKLGDPLKFPFLDAPVEKAFNDGYRTLLQIGAIDNANQITEIGLKIANIPLDAQLARVLIAATDYACLSEILIIISFLAIQDPREYPLEFQQIARERHSVWADKDSELSAVLNIWQWYHDELSHKKSNKKLLEVCRKQFISLVRLKEWHELYGQLKEILYNLGYKENMVLADNNNVNLSNNSSVNLPLQANLGHEENILLDEKAKLVDGKNSISVNVNNHEIAINVNYNENINKKESVINANLSNKERTFTANYEAIHRAILTGFVTNIGQKDLVENYYLGTNSKKFLVHPSSLITKPKWILSCNLIETSKLYARTNARIDPSWLLPITTHLVKYNYSNEHWSAKRGEVIATKSILLYGLLLAEQTVSYGHINPELARELMIKQGLVLNQLPKMYKFITYNNKIIDEIEKLEDKMRMSFVLLDDELFNFYSANLPENICDIPSLDVWLNEVANNINKLYVDQELLINKLVDVKETVELYPEYLENNEQKLKIKYVFDEQDVEDGMVILCELAQINEINPDYFSWLVPGLIRDKISYLIKSLPKGIRFSFNPLAEFITDFLNVANLKNHLFTELSKYIEQTKKIIVSAQTFEEMKLPAQYICHFNILQNGKLIVSGDNLLELRSKCAPELSNFVKKYTTPEHKENITTWIDELLNLLIKREIKANTFAYMSLLVENNQINLSLISEYEKAVEQTKRGMLALIKLQLKDERKHLERKKINNFANIALGLADIYNKDLLLQDCINYIFGLAINVDILPKTADEFSSKVTLSRQNLAQSIVDFSYILSEIAKFYQAIKLKLDKHALAEVIFSQLDDLIYPEFLHYVRWEQLGQYPRYLQAILYRMDKYANNISRDKANENAVNELYTAWYDHIERLESQHKIIPQQLYLFKYKIEELRISLFATLMKTLYPVSLKRLHNELEQIIREI